MALPKRATIDLLLNQHSQSLRQTLRHFPVDGILDDLAHLGVLVNNFQSMREKIDNDNDLTTSGKGNKNNVEAHKAVEEISKESGPKLRGYDNHISSLRAQLINTQYGDAATRPSAQEIATMRDQLRKFTSQEVAVLYGGASPAEKRVMEAADAAARIPVKDGRGLRWETLLAARDVNDDILERAEAKDPETFAQYTELQEIRSTYSTVAEVAKKAIKGSIPYDWVAPIKVQVN